MTENSAHIMHTQYTHQKKEVQVRIHFEPRNCHPSLGTCAASIPTPETRPRLHNPLGLSRELKSSSTGPQLGAKTAETAIPKLTQMVQSPPHTFWYVFCMNINARYWTC